MNTSFREFIQDLPEEEITEVLGWGCRKGEEAGKGTRVSERVRQDAAVQLEHGNDRGEAATLRTSQKSIARKS
jgi:hypothetical protein